MKTTRIGRLKLPNAFALALLLAGVILSPAPGHAGGATEDAPHGGVHQIDIEVEPIAYILGGAGVTIGYRVGSWRYAIEVYGLNVPERLHGNEGFDAAGLGVELHIEHFFDDRAGGFHFGPELALSRLDVTHRESGETTGRLNYSVGLRGGYRWYTGVGGLYLNPVGGFMYTLNAADIELADESFETGSLTPFVTVGAGWRFRL